MKFLLLLIALALFVGALWLCTTLGANNSLLVDLDLIWLQIPGIEIWRLVLAAIILGILLAGTFLGFFWARDKFLLGRYKRMVRKLEKEIHELRSLPLVGSGPTGEVLDGVPELAPEATPSETLADSSAGSPAEKRA